MSGIYHPTSGGQINEQMDRCTDKWTTGRIDKWMDGFGRMDELMDRQMDGQKDGRMDKQTDGQTEG